MKYFYVIALILGLSGLSAVPTSTQAAQESEETVFISEINWAGSEKSTADEWIELFNPARQSMDLSGWVLTGAATSGNALELAEGTFIEANQTLLISNYGIDHEKTTLLVEPNLVSTSLALPNANLEIILADQNGMVFDRVEASNQVGSTAPATSMYRDTQGKWQASTTTTNLSDPSQFGTPGIHEYTEEEQPVDTEQEVETEEIETPTEIQEEFEQEDTPVAQVDCVHEDVEPQEESIEPEEELIENVIPEETDVTVEEEPAVETPTDPAPTQDTNTEEPVTELPTYATGDLLINEFVSNPEDGVEWVEIYNPGTEPIPLLHFGVMDASGKLTTFPEIELAPGDYYIVENPAGNLNNSGDTIHLFDPSGFIIDEVTYGNDLIPSPEKGESLARVENDWLLIMQPTKASKNYAPEPENTEETVSVDEEGTGNESETVATNEDSHTSEVNDKPPTEETPVVKEEIHEVIEIIRQPEDDAAENQEQENEEPESSTQKSVTGTVTALPGTFGKQIAFIEGLQLYFHHADWPELKIGDEVIVTGEPSVSRGEERIKISSAEDILVTAHTAIEAVSLTIKEATTANPGTLVEVEGLVSERNGDKLVLEHLGERMTVVAHNNTNISLKSIAFGELRVTGVVRTIDGEVRIYPRNQNDLQPIETEIMEESNSDSECMERTQHTQQFTPWVGGGITAATGSSFLYWFRKRKNNE